MTDNEDYISDETYEDSEEYEELQNIRRKNDLYDYNHY